MSMNNDRLEKLKTLLGVVNESITKQEFVTSFKAVLDFVKQIDAKNTAEFDNFKVQFKQLSNSLKNVTEEELDTIKSSVNTMMKDCMSEMLVEHEAKMQAMDAKMMEVQNGIDGENGKDADEEEIIKEVLKQLPKVELDEPLDIVEKLESLKDEYRLDASAIKNLPESKGGRWGGGLSRGVADTLYAPLGTTGGVDTANSPLVGEFARFTDADTIEGRTATETRSDLGLVIGTNVQAYSANLDEYAAVNPTAAGLALLDDADTAAQLVTLGFTASITELNYTDGVTSAIQTQLNAKGNVTKVGTPVDNQIGVWTGDGTIEGDANFTWDGTTHTILGTSLLSKTGTATVGTQTYDSNEYKLQGSQWFTSGSVAKTLTGGMTIKPRNPGAIVTSTLDFGYAIDSSTERPVISYKVGDHYNDGFAGQLTLRSGYWDGIGSFATGYGSAFGGMIETQYDGTFAFRPVGGSGTTFSGMRALSFGTHSTYASFWSRWGYGGGSNYGADIRTSFDGTVTIGAGLPDWHASAPAGASGSESLSVTIDQVITGNNASRPALRITKATEQLRLGYDASNYFSTTVASTGSTTFNLVGTSPEFTFSDPVNVPDEAYGAGWNGNTEVPTKNALYDKIETLGGGSGITRTVVTTSGSITLGAAASVDYTYYVAGAHTLSMPSPNTNRYTIKNLHSAAITVDTAGAETIEGAASLSLQPNDSIDVLSDGTNWYVH